MRRETVEVETSTRERVIGSILEHGPSTAAQLAARLQLTPAAIRRHLAALVDHGRLTSREERRYGNRGRGRPAKVFVLTDEGRDELPQAYDDLAIRAIQELVEVAGPDALHRLAHQRAEPVVQRYRELADDGVDPSEALTEALNDAGFAASRQDAPAGEQLCQYHCPVAHVAERFPELCAAETELFADLLGVHVQRLATIAHGDEVCTTHIPHVGSRSIRKAEL